MLWFVLGLSRAEVWYGRVYKGTDGGQSVASTTTISAILHRDFV
jgi:hypothetical protein